MKRSLINKRWLKVGFSSLILAASGGLALAQISVVDGSLTTGMVGAANGSGGASISTSFTVSAPADALVVQVYDRSQGLSSDTSGGSTGGLDPLSLAWGTQSIGRVGYQSNLTSHYGDSIIYALYNPIAGVNNITYTDISGQTPSNLSMQIYSLSGVDTGIAPVFFSIGNADIGGNPLNLSVSATTTGAWASMIASIGDSGGGFPNNDHLTANSGTVAYQWLVENQSALAGAAQGIAADNTTLTVQTANGGSSPQVGFAAAVFEPSAVPEPSTLFLGGLGLLGFISLIRRKIS